MNKKYIAEAIEQINNNRQSVIETYNSRLSEISEKIPSIPILQNYLSSVSSKIITSSLMGHINIESKISEIKRNHIKTQEQIKELLIKNNYPSNYLDINYNCPKCSDTGYYNNDFCSCVYELAQKIYSQDINKSLDFHHYSFDNFSLSRYSKTTKTEGDKFKSCSDYEHMKNVFNALKNYSYNFKINHNNPYENSNSIIIYGKTGLGKTHMVNAMAEVITSLGYSVLYDTADLLFSRLADERFSKNEFKNDTLNSILNADLLIIDDLYDENNNKFYKSALYTIINTRYSKSLPIIITTNHGPEVLKYKFDERIVSRLLTYKQILFVGKDSRQEQSLNNLINF